MTMSSGAWQGVAYPVSGLVFTPTKIEPLHLHFELASVSSLANPHADDGLSGLLPIQSDLPSPPLNMEAFNIAIIGAAGVGKSSFVQGVLDLARPPISNASSVRIVVDNATHMVTLLELDLESFELSPAQPIQWPKQMNGHIIPRVDAALIMYDVTKEESIKGLPQTLGRFQFYPVADFWDRD